MKSPAILSRSRLSEDLREAVERILQDSVKEALREGCVEGVDFVIDEPKSSMLYSVKVIMRGPAYLLFPGTRGR